MKTFIISTLNVLFTLILFLPYVYAETPLTVAVPGLQKVTSEDRVGTIIDVKGSRFSDRMWVITVPQCTRDFDNGWDGYKMFGSPVTPQIFAMEACGNFQVNSVPDINNTYIGFLAGEDSVYTLTFTHYFLDTRYKELFLVDLKENKTINIYASGSQYTFVAKKTAAPEKRFKLISTDFPPVIVPENNVGTVIDVLGTRFNDQMSIYSVPECTSSFDKAWDSYKTFGSPLNPQIYAMESDGNYKVNAVNDINNTYLGFLPGEDTNYTLKFTNYNLGSRYQKLYLVDLLENKTIDIYASGTEYSFVAEQSNTPVKRFNIITVLPEPVIDIYSEGYTNPNNPKAPKDIKELKEQNKKLKIFNSQRTIIVDNPNNDKGNLTLYSAQSGRLVASLSFNANGITTIPTNVPDGIYVAKGVTNTDMVAERIIIR